MEQSASKKSSQDSKHYFDSKKVQLARNRIRASHLFVKDLMSMDLFTLYEDDTFQVLSEIMNWQRIRHIPVINQEDKLVGLVSHRDLLRVSISALADIPKAEVNEIYAGIRIGDIMQKKVVSITPDAPISEAAQRMAKEKFGCLPVVEKDGRLVGIITEADFMSLFCG